MLIQENNNQTVNYLYKDHLGSPVAVTDEQGNVIYEQNFDAWGRRRNSTDWTYTINSTQPNWLRGYTGHEMLDDFRLVNMNNRLYDPVVGRMLSVDNYVANNNATQAYNRYSYTLNNPLKYTDPSGEFIWIAPIITGAIIGTFTGAVRAANTPNMTLGAGAWKGATVGAVGGALSLIGGGTFVANVAWGMGQGAFTGGLDAYLWDNNIGSGMLYGAAIGGTLALGQSTVQSIKNYKDYGMFGTNDGVFDRMVDDAVSGGRVNTAKAQNSLNFWTDRFGGPSMNYKLTGSPSTSSAGDVYISRQKFIDGVKHVRRAIAHEHGHYFNNVNWDNGQVGTKVSDPSKFINLDRTKFGGDGIHGYHGAIKNSGRYHVGYSAISDGKTAPLVAPAWKQFGWAKWFYLIPTRF